MADEHRIFFRASFDEIDLEQTLFSMCEHLNVNLEPHSPTTGDRLMFVMWIALILFAALLPVVVGAVAVCAIIA